MSGPEDAVTDALGAILSLRITLALAVLRGIQDGVPAPVQRGLQVVIDVLTGDEVAG